MDETNSKVTLRDRIQQYKIRFGWIMGYCRKHILAIVFYTAIGMTGTVVALLSGLVSKDLVDIITGHQTGALIKTFIMLIATQVVSVAINNISSYTGAKISMQVENGIKSDIYREIMTTDWQEISAYHSGQIVARWSGDSSNVANGILNTFPNMVISLFRFVSSLYLVIKYDWTFTIFVLIGVPLSFLVSRRNLSKYKQINMEYMEASAKMSGFSQDSFSNIQNVKALDMIKLYMKKLKDLQKEVVDVRLKSQRASIRNSLIMVIVSQLVTYSTYGWGVYRVWSGAITYGTMTMFLSLSQSLSGTAQSIINIVPSTIGLANAAQRIMDILKLPKEDYSDEDKVLEFYDNNRESGIGIRVEDASFSYMSGTQVFENVSFEVKPREIVGLIGPSGEGKTTMLRLLLAIINASEGAAYITDLKNEDRIKITAAARQLIAYVPQGNTMFPGTIAENMRNVKEDATDEEIIEALKLACAWDFVSKLPEGIDFELKERGGGLSEGQSQRLSIARALLRKSPVLLLDEATSALDMETEKKVLENITQDTYPRACIVTTHRQEVMDACHKVYKIKNMKISPED